MNDTAALIQAALRLEEAANILRRLARPDIPAPRDGQIEDFLAAGIVAPGTWTPAPDIRAAYETWCAQTGREALTVNAYGRALTDAGIVSRRTTNGLRLRNLALIPAPSEASP